MVQSSPTIVLSLDTCLTLKKEKTPTIHPQTKMSWNVYVTMYNDHLVSIFSLFIYLLNVKPVYLNPRRNWRKSHGDLLQLLRACFFLFSFLPLLSGRVCNCSARHCRNKLLINRHHQPGASSWNFFLVNIKLCKRNKNHQQRHNIENRCITLTDRRAVTLRFHLYHRKKKKV